jgi:hydroxymethylglutaryl-CoA lyase
MLAAVIERVGASSLPKLTLHLHDTFGRAAECLPVALEMGLRSFDGAAGGLGGCPYASTASRRAPGNVATEALVRAVHAAGYATGVDLDKLDEAARYARYLVAPEIA